MTPEEELENKVLNFLFVNGPKTMIELESHMKMERTALNTILMRLFGKNMVGLRRTPGIGPLWFHRTEDQPIREKALDRGLRVSIAKPIV